MGTDYTRNEFDKFTSQIIFYNKYRTFNPYIFPLPEDKLDEAVSIYNQRKKLNRGEVNINIMLASIFLEKEDYDSVIEECKKAIDINPNYAKAYSNLCCAYLNKEMIKEAENACNNAIRLDPALPEPHNLLGILFEKREQIKEAEIEYQKALELKPDSLEAHLNLGNLYFKMKFFTQSVLHYKKVIEIKPGYAQVLNNLAVVFFYEKEYTLAWEYLKKAEDLGYKVHPEFKKAVLRKHRKKLPFQMMN